jgi:branched-chain amino acid transport system permease protein
MKKSRKTTINNFVTYGIVLVVYGIVQMMINGGNISSLMQGLLIPLCVYAILAVSLNLTVGILGELSLGHAGFMCVGAFTGALFTQLMETAIPSTPIRFGLAILVGIIFAGLSGLLIGIPVLRLKGDYLAIVTLAFGEIIKNLVNVIYVGSDKNGLHISFKSSVELGLEPDGQVIISGAQGITGTPKNATFFICIVILIITLIVINNLIHSRAGRAVMAIRDNRIAAESIGLNITKYKLLAFSISAAFAGAAGVLYAHNLATLTATSKNFGYNMSIMILVFVVLGGIGNIRGSMFAAVILTLLPELLRNVSPFVSENRMLFYAIILIGMMLFSQSPKAIDFRSRYLNFHKLFKKEAKKEVQ